MTRGVKARIGKYEASKNLCAAARELADITNALAVCESFTYDNTNLAASYHFSSALLHHQKQLEVKKSELTTKLVDISLQKKEHEDVLAEIAHQELVEQLKIREALNDSL